MPKASTITKEVVLDAAFEIARTSGFSSLSARSIALHIGCSTQPIYWVYDNMDLLRADIAHKAIDYLNDVIQSYYQTGKQLVDLGLGYIYVAYKEPFLFKAIYVDNLAEIRFADLPHNEKVIDALKSDGFIDNLENYANKACVFAHSIASLVAVGMMEYDKDKIERLLISLVDC